MTKNRLKKSQIIALVLSTSFLVFGIYYSTTQYKINSPEYTVGTIVPMHEGDKRVMFRAKFEYFVEGKRYTLKWNSAEYKFNVIGEKYLLKYDKDNPKRSKIIATKPLFLKYEKTYYTKGYINRVYYAKPLFFHSNPTIGLEYSYPIGDVKFIKSQEVPEIELKTYLDSLLENKIPVVVECWAEDARRAIIHLDKPLK